MQVRRFRPDGPLTDLVVEPQGGSHYVWVNHLKSSFVVRYVEMIDPETGDEGPWLYLYAGGGCVMQHPVHILDVIALY